MWAARWCCCYTVLSVIHALAEFVPYTLILPMHNSYIIHALVLLFFFSGKTPIAIVYLRIYPFIHGKTYSHVCVCVCVLFLFFYISIFFHPAAAAAESISTVLVTVNNGPKIKYTDRRKICFQLLLHTYTEPCQSKAKQSVPCHSNGRDNMRARKCDLTKCYSCELCISSSSIHSCTHATRTADDRIKRISMEKDYMYCV